MKKFVMAILVVTLLSATFLSGCTSSGKTAAEEVTAKEQTEVQPVEEETPVVMEKPEKAHVGDDFVEKNLRCVYVSSGEYQSDNDFIQPDAGNKLIYLEFYFENTGDDDKTVSAYDFEGYADGYSAEQQFIGVDGVLSAELSAGRSTMGKVYFEIPIDAKSVEIEQTVNLFSDDKIVYLYEGDKTCDFIPPEVSVTEGAYHVGDVAELNGLKISYDDCTEYISDNQFLQPAEGNHYITFAFTFENTSDSDETVSSFEFSCYADGQSCSSSISGENDLGTVSLSAGRKASGNVTFEVPIDAANIELEYSGNIFTSEHIVFSAK